MEVGDKMTISVEVVVKRVLDNENPCAGCCFYNADGGCTAYGEDIKCWDKKGNEFIFQIAD